MALLSLLLFSPPILLFLKILQIQSTSSPPSLISPHALVLPLKTHTLLLASTSSRQPSFHHNVTLTVSLSVGLPPQNVTRVLDTGSELPRLHCKKKEKEKKENPEISTPFFNPLLSSSYSPTPCTSILCASVTRDFPIHASCDSEKLCQALISYADASSVEGNLATDTVLVGSSALPVTICGCMCHVLSKIQD